MVGVHDLTLVAEATDTDGLTRIQDVLGGHLERFGQRNELIVAWSAPVDPAAVYPVWPTARKWCAASTGTC